jgi:hypothetical protein
MRANLPDVAFRLAAATGLAVSLLLLWEYTGEGASLCGDGGGCDAVPCCGVAPAAAGCCA